MLGLKHLIVNDRKGCVVENRIQRILEQPKQGKCRGYSRFYRTRTWDVSPPGPSLPFHDLFTVRLFHTHLHHPANAATERWRWTSEEFCKPFPALSSKVPR